MNKSTRILIVEDKSTDADLAKYTIGKVLKDCEFQIVETHEDFINSLEVFQPDVILSDYNLPRFDGMKALELTMERAPLTPLIIWTGSISEDVAVECMKAGANNYVLKENIKRLVPAIVHALEERRLLVERKQVEEKYQSIIESSVEGIFQSTPEGRYVNVNPAMARIYGYASPKEMIESIKSIADQIYVDSNHRTEFLRLLNLQDVVHNFEERNFRKDGSIIWTSTSARAVRDSKGNILYFEGFIKDITQRKQTEEALQNSEKRFRALIENGLDDISLLAADGTLLWESPSTVRNLGYSLGEFLSRNIFELMHPDDLEWTRNVFARLVQDPGDRQRGLFRLRRSDDSWRWVEAIATNMLNEPSVNAIVINYRDITERKQAEEALRESQARYQNLVETSHDLIWSVDAEGKITFLNQAAKEIYGYEPQELIGHSFYEIMEPEHYSQENTKNFKEAMGRANDEFRGIESPIRRKDGKKIILSANSIVIRDEDGNLIGLTGSSRDITERKQMEEALREERNLLRTLIDNIPDRIYAMDTQGQKTLSNTADWKASGGKTREDVIGKTDFDTYPPELAEPFWQLNRVVLDAGQPVINFEEPGLDFEGNPVSILTTKIPLRDDEGKVTGLVGIGRDITERKRVELERQALLEIMQGFANTTDLQELLQLVHYAIAKVIYAENFFVVLYHENSGLFEEIYSVDQYDPPAAPSKLEKSITSYVFRSGEPLLLTQDSFDGLEAQGEVVLVGTNSASWLGVPLKTSGRVIGVIAVQDYENDNRYSEHDKDFLASIATQIALAIEHREAGEALRESEEHYRTIFEGVQDAIFVEAIDGRILMVNERACEMFGYSQEEFLTKKVTDIVPQGHLILAVNGKDMPLSAEPRETVNQRANGENFPVEISGRLQEINGEPVLLVVVRDITERKQAENKLRESEERYRGLFENLVIGFALHEIVTDEAGKPVDYVFLEINPAFEKLTGIDAENTIGKRVTEVLPGIESDHFIPIYGQVALTGTPAYFEQFSEQLGKYYQLNAYSPKRGQFAVTFADITERKQAEIELSQKNDDLSLLNAINDAVVRGENLDAVVELLGKELQRIFSMDGSDVYSTMYMLTSDKQSIRMQKYFFSAEVAHRIEKLIGFSIPAIEIPIKEGGHFHQAMTSKRSAVTSDPDVIQNWLMEFTETKFLYPLARAASRKLIPQIHKLMNIKSLITIPLISEEETIGFLNISTSGRFTINDLKRIEHIGGQLTAVIQRQQANEKIRRSEEFLNSIQNALSASIAILDEDATIVQVNSAWREFGRQNGFAHADQGIGWNYLEITDSATGANAEEAPFVAAAIRDILAGRKEEALIEYPCHSPGQKRWFTLRITKFEDGEGKWIILSHENITKRKLAEEAEREQRVLAEALRDTAETLSSTLDYGQVLDQILVAVGRVVPHDAATIMLIEGNSAYVVRSSGYDSRNLNFDVMGVKLPLTETNNLRQMFETGQTIVVSDTHTYTGWQRLPETDWLHSNVGAPISIQDKVIGFILLDSQIPGFFTSVHAERLEAFANQAALAIHNAHLLQQAQEEIAERKRAELALIESTAQFRTLFEASPDAILLIELENWSIVDCNTAACQMNGYEREELIGQCIDILNEWPGNQSERIAYMERISQNNVLHYETFHRHKNGYLFPVEVSTSLIKIGTRNLILGIDRDIKERKQAEEEIRQRAQETSALLETSLALTNLDLNATLQTVGSSAKSLFVADGCRVFLLEPDDQSLRCVLALQENATAFSDLRIKVGEGVTGAVAISGRAEIVNEMLNDPRAIDVPGTAEGEEEAIMFAPLKERDRTIGVLSIRRAGNERPFQPVDLELLEAFASMAASAVSNARLFEETQHQLTKLHASEERFRQLADNIQEAFWMTDAESGEEIYLSPAAEVIWERPIENLLNEPNAFINTVFPEDQPALLDAINKEKSGKKMEVEYRILRPNGTVRWVWDRAFPIFDDTGKVKRIAGITADITERRESEIALIKSQGRYRELFDSSPISIWEEDYSLVKKQIDRLLKSGVSDLKEYLSSHPEEVIELASLVRIMDANKVALELYNIEQKEVILKPLTQVLSKDALGHFPEEILGLMSRSKRFTWEGTDNMTNGTQIEVIVNGSLPQGYEEDWSKVIVSVSNVTERRQAQQQLRKLSRAVEQSASTIVITDTTGNIEYVNPKFTEITGYSAEEVIGQNPRLLKSGLTSEEVYKGLWQTVVSGKQWQGELLNKKKNAELYWEYVTISPIFNESGEITHFVGVKEDITKRKQSETETQRHLTELEALYENGLAVGQLLTTTEIGERMINTFARYLEWHHVAIQLIKEESNHLELIAFNLPKLREEEKAEIKQHFSNLINRVGQGLSGWVIQTGEPFRTGNVHNHPRYINTQAGIQSGLYMPLKIGDQVIGVISVESETQDAFTEQDERLLATLANQAAIAFENARLYETAQRELAERKRAEEALRVSETHYRELANSITDILFELDQDHRLTHWNNASEMLTGISAKDAIGKSLYEVFQGTEEQTKMLQYYEDVLQNRQPRTFESGLLLQGQKRFFEINAYPSTRGVSVVAKDVTDRKRSEIIMQKRFELMEYSAQHSLKELVQRAMDEVSELTGSSIGFFHFVEEDQSKLQMQTWSTHALQLFHVPLSEGTHRSLDQAGVWADALRQRRPLIQNDYKLLPKRKGLPQGHVPITREMIIPIIRNERIMAVMGVANKLQDYTQYDLEVAEHLADYAWDITERKQMEIALETERNQLAQRVDERTADLSRANSNLARALRVKDEFLANMSHELRTPLNAILGLSESLSEQIAGPLNEKQQKYISTISESGHHLLSLINDILDLAKIDAGQITLDINKVDIRSVCQASLRMIKQLAQKKNQEVSLEIDEELGLMWADERRLKQMIVNLLGNAVKFTPENGKLGLEVHGDEEANKISFTVWDNGIGIKETDLARLFQPFVQLDSGLAREATGTGLGLALVAQMARLHGGSITAFSEPEAGSRFTIILPWEPALAVDSATRMKITGKFQAIKLDEVNKPTVLLVEDTKEVTMMIKDYLELAGYKVVTAQDGVDAIVQAKLVRPDLILMDVQMPRMDGLEATRRLRSEPDFRYTPIIALTALAMPSDRERCIEAGMDDYISKPVNLKALVKIIQGCLFNGQEVKSR